MSCIHYAEKCLWGCQQVINLCLLLLILLSAMFLFMILLCCIHCCCFCGKPKYQATRVQPLQPVWRGDMGEWTPTKQIFSPQCPHLQDSVNDKKHSKYTIVYKSKQVVNKTVFSFNKGPPTTQDLLWVFYSWSRRRTMRHVWTIHQHEEVSSVKKILSEKWLWTGKYIQTVLCILHNEDWDTCWHKGYSALCRSSESIFIFV